MKPSVAHLFETELAQEPDRETLVVTGPSGDQRATRAEVNTHARYSAHQLLANGIQPGDVVLMLMEHAYEAVPMFVGAIYMGAVPMVLPYLTPQTAPAQQRERLSSLVNFFQPKAILTLPRFQMELAALGLPVPTLAWDFSGDEALAPPQISLSTRGGEDAAYLQFTSGTTGQPKAVIVPHQMLLTALKVGARWQLGYADVGVVAAPLSHISGLVGAGIGGLMCGMRTVILSPSHWAQQPAILFQAIHQHRATFSILTNSGVNLSLFRIQPEEITGVDLSSLKVVSVGAEMISAASLQAFAQRFGPYGFQSSAFKTAYSASEAYICLQELETHWYADWVSATEMMTKKVATPVAAESADGRAIVACGTPLPGVVVQIRDEEDQLLPDRTLGQIVVKTPVLFSGYWQRPDLTASVLKEGWYYTGDMGYLVNNELFVVGRVKDLIIVGGRNLLPDAVEEQAMAAARGLLRGAVAFGVRDESVGTEQPVVVCELNGPLEEAKQRELGEAIRDRVRQMLDVALADVRFVEGGWIARAGIKVARATNREKYLVEYRAAIQNSAVAEDLSLVEVVTLIFEEILGRKPIDPHENFFDLGGDSISALRLLMRAEKQFGRSVPPIFFKEPTIAHMMKLLETSADDEVAEAKEDEITPVIQERKTPLRPATKRAWTTQRVREALRRRWAARAFQLPYFEGIAWLASWSGNSWVQNVLYPQESQLVRQFARVMGRSNDSNDEEVQRSLMSHIVHNRLSEFHVSEDMQDYVSRLQNSAAPFLRDLGQAIAHPEGELGRSIFESRGQEHLEQAQEMGKGTIIVSFHATARSLGIVNLIQPETPLYWLGNYTYRTIFQELYDGDSEQEFDRQRMRLRAHATQTARQVLHSAGIVGIAADTIDAKSPIRVVIGDRVRPLRVGFAELAIATGAAIIPTYTIQHLDGRISQSILPPLDMGTSRLSHAARVEYLGHQVGEFLAQVWQQAPSTLDWTYMQTHIQLPKAEPHMQTTNLQSEKIAVP